MPEVNAEAVVEEVVKTTEAPVKAVPAADAEEQKTDVAEDENSDTETTEQQEAKRQSKFQRRLERQKTARIAAETEARLLREELAGFKAQSASQKVSDEPKRDDFEDYESYVRAIAKYEAKHATEETLKTDREKAQGSEKQTKEAQAQEATAKNWVEREQTFQKATKDYQEVVTSFVEEDLGSLGEGARRLIIDSEVGPQLLYHLASHPEIADRIADLSSVRQIAELGKLEEKLSTPAKKTSNAPTPPNHVNTGKTGSKDPSKMNQTEYRAWMKANGSRFA